MRLQLLGIPHTVTRSDFSHCAFTTKVRLFSSMMRAQGLEVIHYGVEGAESGANEQVTVMSRDEHLAHLAVEDYHEEPSRMFGDDGVAFTPLYRQFNYTLRQELKERLEPGDIICVPFGPAHETAYRGLPLVRSKQVAIVETGIGYPDTCTYYRAFESEAWRHYHMGKESRQGASWESPRIEWVIPNFYDEREWSAGLHRDSNRVVYLGRLKAIKGLELVPWLAERRPDLQFVLCGQGDPTPFLTHDNITYEAPISGVARATFLGRARAVLCPSRYLEPFCGVNVEAQLCGTPVITSDFGAFTETVIQGVTGFRCRTRQTFLDALDLSLATDPSVIRESAVRRYSLAAIGTKYAAAFGEVADAMVKIMAVV